MKKVCEFKEDYFFSRALLKAKFGLFFFVLSAEGNNEHQF